MKTYPVLIIEKKPTSAKSKTSTAAEPGAAELDFVEEVAAVGAASAPAHSDGPKTRSFSARLLSYVTANKLWAGGETDSGAIRPVLLRLAGSEQELRAFVANLQSGYKAALQEEGYSRSVTRFELLKSGGYRYLWQKVELEEVKLAVVTAYIPELVQLDPGMVDPTRAAFVMLPPRWWVEREVAGLVQAAQTLSERGADGQGQGQGQEKPGMTQLEGVFDHAIRLGLLKPGANLSDLGLAGALPAANTPKTKAKGRSAKVTPDQAVTATPTASSIGANQSQSNERQLTARQLIEWLPVAAYFAAYLDKRTTRPLLDELPFYVQLLFCALAEGIAALPKPRPGDYSYREEQDKWKWARKLDAGFYEFGAAEGGGIHQPIVCLTEQSALDRFLASQVRLYLGLKQGKSLAELLKIEQELRQKAEAEAKAQAEAARLAQAQKQGAGQGQGKPGLIPGQGQGRQTAA